MNANLQKYSRAALTPWGTDHVIVGLRIIVGALLIYHGTSKVFEGFDQMTAELTLRGWPLPGLQAMLATYVEFAGGVMLMVGLFTRPVLFAIIVEFMIIYFMFSANDVFAKKEKALIFLVLAIALFLFGPGKLSVDAHLFKAENANGGNTKGNDGRDQGGKEA
ncbi:hypothetical protein BH10BAC6_BH10BAC6_08020 [soil metagenome]